MQKLIELLFGCAHNFGFPITRRIGSMRITMRVCLECGRVRKYDWARMRFIQFERGEERQLRTHGYGVRSVAP
jgi:hypothetical protein